jgi:hypothetical protein
MPVAITGLPRIVETLTVDGRPQFFVLLYNEFVGFVVAASARHAPDVVSVLDHGGEHVFVVLPNDGYRAYIVGLDISGEVDEVHYLGRHTDVKVAVQQGALRSGTQHYLIQGYFERREVRIPAAGSASAGRDRAAALLDEVR